jgi:hypothetical protein
MGITMGPGSAAFTSSQRIGMADCLESGKIAADARQESIHSIGYNMGQYIVPTGPQTGKSMMVLTDCNSPGIVSSDK